MTIDYDPPAEAGSARLAVLGSPIAHSKSPLLHAAAYRLLGLDWAYGRDEVRPEGFDAFMRGRGAGWRGFSVTAPLKPQALAFGATASATAHATGGANTVVFRSLQADAEADVHNTDVPGFAAALRERGVGAVRSVELFGAGSTAASALAACAGMGASHVRIVARAPERARATAELAERLGLSASVVALGSWTSSSVADDVDLVVNTVPGGVALPEPVAADVVARAALFDVVYAPWPTGLAAAWLDGAEADAGAAASATASDRTTGADAEAGAPSPGGPVVCSGLDLLVHQAVVQVRLFTGRAEDEPLPDETAILAAMRAAATAGRPAS